MKRRGFEIWNIRVKKGENKENPDDEKAYPSREAKVDKNL